MITASEDQLILLGTSPETSDYVINTINIYAEFNLQMQQNSD